MATLYINIICKRKRGIIVTDKMGKKVIVFLNTLIAIAW